MGTPAAEASLTMVKYEIEWRDYGCHPETCCHWEHLPFWIVRLTPWKQSGLHGYSREWVEGFNSREDAEAALKKYVRSEEK